MTGLTHTISPLVKTLPQHCVGCHLGIKMNMESRAWMMYTIKSAQGRKISITGLTILKTHRQKNFKYNVIRNASEVFNLSPSEEENLANKAGLSMKADQHFHSIFNVLIQNNPCYKDIYERAQISERMFHYIKKDIFPTKQSLLALSISLGMGREEIEDLLPKAGYALSASIAYDAIIKELLVQPSISGDYKNAVAYINNILFSLGLPLLMTRDKNQ